MTRSIRCSGVLLLLTTVLASGQGRPGGGSGGGGRTTNPPNPSPGLSTRTTPTMPEIERPTFISGKAVLSDGSEISEPVAIETVCSSRRRIETYTDSHGNFSFELKKKSDSVGLQTADIASVNDDAFSRSNRVNQWRDCEVLAVLPGFTSELVALARWMPITEATDIGRITLRPIGGSQGSVMSATSLAAPKAARKAVEKAREQERKHKLDDARESLQKAVKIYPEYAAAWTELGNLNYMNHDPAAARQCYDRALAADAKYAKPYLGLAQLAADGHDWAALVATTDKLLALDSAGFPVAWYLKAVGHYSLEQLEPSEASVRSGLKVDTEHRVPRLEYLLGMILMRKRDYLEAASHMREFQRLSTEPADVAEAQKQLAHIEQLSASAGAAPSAK